MKKKNSLKATVDLETIEKRKLAFEDDEQFKVAKVYDDLINVEKCFNLDKPVDASKVPNGKAEQNRVLKDFERRLLVHKCSHHHHHQGPAADEKENS